ncbi:MAG: MEKHLA domain-containing protein [Verrucomicrobiales bacterium]|nr:MEKHLA domain-containing protein [Verrucomicrobiales bacterium]
MDFPAPQNRFLVDHARLLLSSYETLTGRQLISACDEEDMARELFYAPFFVASHSLDSDPVLTYGNETALQLFELPWEKFTGTPSRFTAEAPEREERERLLDTVARQGYIDDYSGIRISSRGRRFEIRNATVWNLIDDVGVKIGQAATFSEWGFLK